MKMIQARNRIIPPVKYREEEYKLCFICHTPQLVQVEYDKIKAHDSTIFFYARYFFECENCIKQEKDYRAQYNKGHNPFSLYQFQTKWVEGNTPWKELTFVSLFTLLSHQRTTKLKHHELLPKTS